MPCAAQSGRCLAVAATGPVVVSSALGEPPALPDRVGPEGRCHVVPFRKFSERYPPVKPIRVALGITDLEVGGAEQALVELVCRLDRSRFAPAVFCLGPRPSGPEGRLVERLDTSGIEAEFLGAQHPAVLPRVLTRLIRWFHSTQPQVVQTFLFHANLVGRVAARWAGVPRVVSGIRVAERAARWHLWLDRATSCWVDRYVCVSDSVAKFSVDFAGLPAEKVSVIPNGVDLERFRRVQPADLTRLGIAPERRVITFVGRLDRQKGVDWLLGVAPEFLDPLPDVDLLLVGKGPWRQRLEQIAERQGIARRVFFAGWQSDVAAILAASQLVVLPSRWEGMPNVVLEAMASGCPVVATNVEGVRTLLGAEPEQLVAFGDSPGLARRVVRIMSDPKLRSDLGLRNYRRAARCFSIGQTVAAYQQLWTELVR